jgi:hypothetical protein
MKGSQATVRTETTQRREARRIDPTRRPAVQRPELLDTTLLLAGMVHEPDPVVPVVQRPPPPRRPRVEQLFARELDIDYLANLTHYDPPPPPVIVADPFVSMLASLSGTS